MFSFIVNQLLHDRSPSDEGLIRHHCQHFARHWGEQNLVVRFIDAIEFLPPESCLSIGGEEGRKDFPFLRVEINIPRRLKVACSMNGSSVRDRTPFLHIVGADAESTAQGNMREFMPGFLNFAQMLGAEKAKLSATNIGKYAWARFGFLPEIYYREPIKIHIQDIFNPSEIKDENDVRRIKEVISKIVGYPQALRDLFSVRYVDPQTNQSFAKKVLLSAGQWSGKLDIRPDSKDLAYTLNYCRLAACRIRVA